MNRNICIVTGTRAEYGLLRWVMQGIEDANSLTLQIIVTGMHLSPEFGLTYKCIEEDGFVINKKVEMLLSSDTPTSISKSVGLGLIGISDALQSLKPDLLLVLGDRFEIFSAVIASMFARIPVAHLHGGEATEGANDESIRHAITKMSHFHFVAADEYRSRVIQLGENPEKVFLVGGLGLDNLKKLKLLDKKSTEKSLGLEFGVKNLLITFHSVTLECFSSEKQIDELLMALEQLEDTNLIFTLPNADTDGRILIDKIKKFSSVHQSAQIYTSLGQLRYLSCLQFVDGVVGNSSSGLIEAPSFKIGTINIGDRQRGRLKAGSVIDCLPEKDSIITAINSLYTDGFQKKLMTVKNPYGTGGASEKIVDILTEVSFDDILKKKFHNMF